MKTSKMFRIHGYDAKGTPLIFDTIVFSKVIDQIAKAQKSSINEVFRMIIKDLYPGTPEKNMESTISKLKNWKYGNNGPSNTEEISKMESILGCNLRRPSTLYSNKSEERIVTHMSTSNTLQETVLVEHTQISHEENIAAKEAYSTILDLICVHHEVMHRYIHAGTPIQGASGDCIPSNFPTFADVYYKLRKLRFDLPYEVFTHSISLAREIYGFWNADFENYRNEGFLDMTERTEEFARHLSECGKECTDESTRFFTWIDFANGLAKEYCEMLDSIFGIYLK